MGSPGVFWEWVKLGQVSLRFLPLISFGSLQGVLSHFFLKLFVSSTKDDIIFWWLEFPGHQEKHKLDMDRLHLGGLPGGSGLNLW